MVQQQSHLHHFPLITKTKQRLNKKLIQLNGKLCSKGWLKLSTSIIRLWDFLHSHEEKKKSSSLFSHSLGKWSWIWLNDQPYLNSHYAHTWNLGIAQKLLARLRWLYVQKSEKLIGRIGWTDEGSMSCLFRLENLRYTIIILFLLLVAHYRHAI